MKISKKLLSTVLAMGILASAGSVFAAPVTDLGGLSNVEVTVDGTVTLPTISVTLPTSATFAIDPFNTAGKGQIASTEFKIVNESTVAVDVVLNEFKVTTGTGSDIVMATTEKLSPTSTKKDVFMNLQAAAPVAEGEAAVYPTFDAKLHAKRIVKVGKGLNEKLGTLEAGDTAAQEIALKFDGAVNANVVWTAEDTLSVVPVFKIAPQVVVTP